MLFFSLFRIYYWYDERGKKTKCTAPQYVDFVMSLCQKLVTDEEIFPTKYGEFSSEGYQMKSSQSAGYCLLDVSAVVLLPPAASGGESMTS